MALGLNGHLTNLTAFNTFEYLHDKHELTVIGILLGISAARYVITVTNIIIHVVN